MPAVSDRPISVPTVHLIVRTNRAGVPFYDAKWLSPRTGKQTMRRVGAAWLDRDRSGEWVKRPGRPRDGALDHRAATVAANALVEQVEQEGTDEAKAQDELERERQRVTFRKVAHAYLDHLDQTGKAKPSTLRSHRSRLAEPGTPHRRGKGRAVGHVMAALGDKTAESITTADVDALLASIAAGEGSIKPTPRTVNGYREIISAVFNYGRKPSTFGLPSNPVAHAVRRTLPQRPALDYYSVEEIEALARALERGVHRTAQEVGDDEKAWRQWEDEQDADIVRIAAYCGLRRGELIALTWRDVDLAGSKLIVQSAISDGQITGTKSRQARTVPIPPQALRVLDRREQAVDPAGHTFTTRGGYVFRTRDGQHLDGSALRRRYVAARNRAGLRPLRFHDLRHSYGSLLVAGGVDLVSVKSAMGHAQITTTERYLHARPAHEAAEKFGKAFEPSEIGVPAPAAA